MKTQEEVEKGFGEGADFIYLKITPCENQQGMPAEHYCNSTGSVDLNDHLELFNIYVSAHLCVIGHLHSFCRKCVCVPHGSWIAKISTL